jgi:hypothetical protein
MHGANFKNFPIIRGDIELNTGNNNDEKDALLRVHANEFNTFTLLTAT